MERLLEVRIGGGDVRDGLMPLGAGRLLDDLVAAVRERGGSSEAWDRLNPHIEIGEGSTRLEVVGDEGLLAQLRPFVGEFCDLVEREELSGKGLDFVDTHLRPNVPWRFIELKPANGSRAKSVRIDAAYRERLLRSSRTPLEALEELYARVVRVGGMDRPTVWLEIRGEGTRAFPVENRDLARRLAGKLYETVRVFGLARWDSVRLSLVEFRVQDLDEDWEDVHLADVMEEHGRLPIKVTVGSVEELLDARRKMRGWGEADD